MTRVWGLRPPRVYLFFTHPGDLSIQAVPTWALMSSVFLVVEPSKI